MIAIIAVNNLGYIGLNNELPWRSSEDLKHFKRLTEGKVLLVGFNTWEKLPRAVLLSTTRFVELDQRDKYIGSTHRPTYNKFKLPVICIGGKKTYEKYAPIFTELHISRINDNTVGDCGFPDLKDLPASCKVFTYNFEVNEKA